MLTQPTAGPRPPAAAGPVPRPEASRAPWGWLEVVVAAQVLAPALLFVPGLTRVRVVTRVASFVVALTAFGVVLASGRRAPGRPFPPTPLLAAVCVLMVAMVLHPTTNSPLAGLAAVVLTVSVASPAFWAGAALRSTRQMERLLLLMLALNSASVLVGIGQFYRPDVFDPPSIPLFELQADFRDSLSIETSDGRKVLRPCGLSDTPGGASWAGQPTCLLGLALAVTPGGRRRRLAGFGLAMAGIAVIYLSQVRSAIMTLALCLVAMVGLLAVQRDYRRAATLAVGSLTAFLLAFAWVLRNGGEKIMSRFNSVVEQRPDELYNHNRGRFLVQAFEWIFEYPLGAGLGRWGQVFDNFGDRTPSADRGPLWAEIQIQAWVIDGGIALLVLYLAATLVALWRAVQVCRTCRDPWVRAWAPPVCAMGLGTVVQCLGGSPFSSPVGVQFWTLMAVLHAAAERARLAGPPAPAMSPRRGAPA